MTTTEAFEIHWSDASIKDQSFIDLHSNEDIQDAIQFLSSPYKIEILKQELNRRNGEKI